MPVPVAPWLDVTVVPAPVGSTPPPGDDENTEVFDRSVPEDLDEPTELTAPPASPEPIAPPEPSEPTEVTAPIAPPAPAVPSAGPLLAALVPPPAGRTRVVIANPADGGVVYWIAKLYGFAALVIVAAFASTAFGVYSYFSLNAPTVPDFARYAQTAPSVTRMYAADGTLMGEFARERRSVVPFERMPKRLVDAFLAVEDHEFFEHRGIYFKGILRAVWRNLTSGDFAQGGSTITQQVCKQFLGAEKSLARKGFEAVCARRLEARYSKRAILSVYLNHIYLGAGAWGVSAAAQTYFKKRLDQLTLAESALIAGLAKAPTKYSPADQTAKQLKRAVERRNVVLDKMAGYGLATADEVAQGKLEPITLQMSREVFPKAMPYYADYVKTYVGKKYGESALSGAGLRIETAAEPTWEAAAYENVDYSTHHQDKRQGWRGPEWRVEGAARDMFVERQRKLYGTGPLEPKRRYLAVVDKVTSGNAELRIGDRRLQLPLQNMKWAARWEAGNAENDAEIGSATAALKPGYVVWVSREIRTVGRYRKWVMTDPVKKNPEWAPADDQHEWDAAHPDIVKLEQVPYPQEVVFTADHHSGHVVAMVGGDDYDRSVYNRATHPDACRSPGSSYKPIYYSLGFQEGYGFDTVLHDVPITIKDPDTGEEWSPNNLGGTLDFAVTLEYALVFSKNIPSVDLFQRLGAHNVEAWARRLGFTTKIFADDALALGASCTYLHEMTRAYSVFARNGAWWPRPAGKEKDLVYVRRIVDRDGNTIDDNTLAADPQLTPAARLERIAALAGIEAPQAIPPRAAFLMTKLLAEEVRYGFTTTLRGTGLNAAGKTGTSSDTHDTTFIAFTPQFTTLVWMGDDKNKRAIGRTDAAYITVVPVWARYMYETAKNFPNPTIPWAVPPGVKKEDRGDHSKGTRGPQMDLIYKGPTKQGAADDDKPPV
ncbi:MAG: Peptidoglycan glycosyltransferase [Deltaproteobacteria bacterium]|nr:Peptidoglycan glycosyltransferase [Deltaproteobacteria bacterium]